MTSKVLLYAIPVTMSKEQKQAVTDLEYTNEMGPPRYSMGPTGLLAPSPLVGEGWGEGEWSTNDRIHTKMTAAARSPS